MAPAAWRCVPASGAAAAGRPHLAAPPQLPAACPGNEHECKSCSIGRGPRSSARRLHRMETTAAGARSLAATATAGAGAPLRMQTALNCKRAPKRCMNAIQASLPSWTWPPPAPLASTHQFRRRQRGPRRPAPCWCAQFQSRAAASGCWQTGRAAPDPPLCRYHRCCCWAAVAGAAVAAVGRRQKQLPPAPGAVSTPAAVGHVEATCRLLGPLGMLSCCYRAPERRWVTRKRRRAAFAAPGRGAAWLWTGERQYVNAGPPAGSCDSELRQKGFRRSKEGSF